MIVAATDSIDPAVCADQIKKLQKQITQSAMRQITRLADRREEACLCAAVACAQGAVIKKMPAAALIQFRGGFCAQLINNCVRHKQAPNITTPPNNRHMIPDTNSGTRHQSGTHRTGSKREAQHRHYKLDKG
jgi:hypothetical protein